MNKPETFADFERDAKRTMITDGDVTTRLVWNALGVAGESGEVVDKIKKLVFHGRDISKEDIGCEIGDVLWYCAALANALGLDLATCAALQQEKMRKRLPNGWNQNDANAYADKAKE